MSQPGESIDRRILCYKFSRSILYKNCTSMKSIWWRIAKSVCKLNKCNKVSPPIKHEGRIIIHPLEKCDIFNKYFAENSNIENEPNLPNEDFALDNICPELLITEQEVKDQLEILNNSKPSGPDGVAPRILRSVSQCLVSPLTLLFNQSLQCGQLRIAIRQTKICKTLPFLFPANHAISTVG